MFAAGGERPDVGGLQDRSDVAAGDRAAAAVGVEDDGLERLLAESLRGQPRVAVHRTFLPQRLLVIAGAAVESRRSRSAK